MLFAVFPTPVGVFLSLDSATFRRLCLPHARGGVSQKSTPCLRIMRSSPRPWGCFLLICDQTAEDYVFPTPVGVFDVPRACYSLAKRLPHARGGVSTLKNNFFSFFLSSPRSWGWFYLRGCMTSSRLVFPTLVGVFPGIRIYP